MGPRDSQIYPLCKGLGCCMNCILETEGFGFIDEISNVYILCTQAHATYPLTLAQLHQSFLLRETIACSKVLRHTLPRSLEMHSIIGP